MYMILLHIFAAIGVLCTGCFLLFIIMMLCSIIYDKRHPGWLDIPDSFDIKDKE